MTSFSQLLIIGLTQKILNDMQKEEKISGYDPVKTLDEFFSRFIIECSDLFSIKRLTFKERK